jgi:hypothetical protein
MIYDSKEYGNNGYGDYLGEFKRVKQLREDAWVDDFIGVNTKTEEVCLILSREVCGYGGGIAYEVIPIPELMLKQYGRWIAIGFMAVKCSECEQEFYELGSTNYCPNCGSHNK